MFVVRFLIWRYFYKNKRHNTAEPCNLFLHQTKTENSTVLSVTVEPIALTCRRLFSMFMWKDIKSRATWQTAAEGVYTAIIYCLCSAPTFPYKNRCRRSCFKSNQTQKEKQVATEVEEKNKYETARGEGDDEEEEEGWYLHPDTNTPTPK